MEEGKKCLLSKVDPSCLYLRHRQCLGKSICRQEREGIARIVRITGTPTHFFSLFHNIFTKINYLRGILKSFFVTCATEFQTSAVTRICPRLAMCSNALVIHCIAYILSTTRSDQWLIRTFSIDEEFVDKTKIWIRMDRPTLANHFCDVCVVREDEPFDPFSCTDYEVLLTSSTGT